MSLIYVLLLVQIIQSNDCLIHTLFLCILFYFQYVNERFSGEYRSRTDDLLRARQAL
jgi:hypothetical protein